MNPFGNSTRARAGTSTPARSGARTLVYGAAALGALALANHLVARATERRHPPRGAFLEVDGVRLHYTDRGAGPPIVLIHGNAVSGDDYDISGLTELLLERHRVVIIDRPGFGYSERPRGQLWTASEQAELLHHALRRLGVERPVVVGHSWGAIVALALAEAHPDDTAGLVLLSGYYFWTLRPDVLQASVSALPVIGDILRYTIAPLLGWLMIPLVKRVLFWPAGVTARFDAEFSPAMTLRPSQLHAMSMDGALMIPGAASLRGGYGDLAMPLVIMAGDGDTVVFKRSAERLHARIEGSVLRLVSGAGHMLHHVVPRQVADAVESVADRQEARPSGRREAA